eukprot:m51a1_g5220 putative amyloid beta precursor protein-binding protein 1 (816) ;mRNA; r:265935-269221
MPTPLVALSVWTLLALLVSRSAGGERCTLSRKAVKWSAPGPTWKGTVIRSFDCAPWQALFIQSFIFEEHTGEGAHVCLDQAEDFWKCHPRWKWTSDTVTCVSWSVNESGIAGEGYGRAFPRGRVNIVVGCSTGARQCNGSYEIDAWCADTYHWTKGEYDAICSDNCTRGHGYACHDHLDWRKGDELCWDWDVRPPNGEKPCESGLCPSKGNCLCRCSNRPKGVVDAEHSYNVSSCKRCTAETCAQRWPADCNASGANGTSVVVGCAERSPATSVSPLACWAPLLLLIAMAAATTDVEKYDRQIRLWGEEAQQRLEQASVCLVNGSATGTEILKNLVLPGIKSFAVVDAAPVRECDLGNNFFVTSDDVGRPRAEAVTSSLLELNDRVHGSCITNDVLRVIEERPEFFKDFSVVVATQLEEASLVRLAEHLWGLGVPLVVARSYGFVGYLRIAAPDHTVFQTRPDNPVHDLRIYNPFPALERFADSFRMEALDSAQHSHVPFIVLLIRALKSWRSRHGGRAPETRAEKDEFKQEVQEGSRNYGNELNFQEAVAAAHRAWTAPEIPSDVRAVFADPRCDAPSRRDGDFWLMAAALKAFVAHEGNGCLPLNGAIPDMAAHTETFVELQRLYGAQFEEELAAFARRVCDVADRVQRVGGHIPSDAVRSFAKNAAFIKYTHYSSLQSEYAARPVEPMYFGNLEDPSNNLAWYVAIRAAETFREKQGHYPGAFDDSFESDIRGLREEVNAFLQKRGVSPGAVKDDLVHELCRWGACELHNVAAFLGGVGAQEVIKIISGCFVPLDNTFIFDGIHCTTQSAQL